LIGEIALSSWIPGQARDDVVCNATMKKKTLGLFFIGLIIAIGIGYFVFYKKPANPLVEMTKHEILTLAKAFQNYHRGDLIYRFGKDYLSLQEARDRLHETKNILQGMLVRLDDPQLPNQPLFDQLFDCVNSLLIATQTYLRDAENIPTLTHRRLNHEVLQLYNQAEIDLENVLAGLSDFKKTIPDFDDDAFIFLFKELMLSTYKLDSYEARHDIYIQLAKQLNYEISPSPAAIIGKNIDSQMNLFFIMRKAKDPLFDKIFTDLVQKFPLYALVPYSSDEEKKVVDELQKLNQTWVHGKKLSFLALQPVDSAEEPHAIVMAEDGSTLQEHLLRTGLAKLDVQYQNLPAKWLELNDRSQNLKLGIFQ